jgi:hypothetical protein
MDRLGGLHWARRTQGRLSGAERRRLYVAVAGSLLPEIAGLVRSLAGRVPKAATSIDVRVFEPPDSRLAREAEEACAAQPAGIAMHSYRTWMLGLALAALDGCRLDPELFYCAALLHDFGLMRPTEGSDFTLASAERAMKCVTAAGLPSASAETVGDAICVHPTVGISSARDGPLGYYVQWGAMADIGGLRRWDITRANIDEVYRRYQRDASFGPICAEMIRAEAKAMPKGRFALYARMGMAAFVQRSAGPR